MREEVIRLERAAPSDSDEICALLNLAYRGRDGWTTESALVQGQRCTADDVLAEIRSDQVCVLVYREQGRIQASISIRNENGYVHIGSFAVNPTVQNKGLGKRVLQHAENYAKETFDAHHYKMLVLSNREELIAFYERRGYTRNGNISKYPRHLNVGVPLDPQQTVEELVKSAS